MTIDRKLSTTAIAVTFIGVLGTGCFGTDDTGNMDEVGSTESDTADTTTTDTGVDPYVFDESPPEMYSQFDRMGMPAVNTAVITSKNQYNADNPTSDINGDYVPEIGANLTGLHMALDDDLTGLGLTPCAIDVCVAQGGPLIIPDTLKLDLTGLAGFPNGRKLADPVMDITLAVVLLDLSVMGQEVTSFIGVLNPAANDVAFSNTFPYLADPN